MSPGISAVMSREGGRDELNETAFCADDAFSGCTRLDTVHIPHGLIGRLDLGELFAGTPWLIASGVYDEQIDWYFANGGTLYITGSGVLYGHSQPWQAYQSQIACVCIGEGITMIDGPAFSGCNAMTACYLPEGLTGIRNEVFRECTGLISVAFPDSLQVIGDYAFYGCANLTGITFNSGLKQIGPYAFAFADALQSVTLPVGLQSIAYTAFYAAGSLERIDVDPDNACFASVDGVVYSADRKTLVLCPRACSDVFIIPEGVTEIGIRAIHNCPALTQLLYEGTAAQWAQIYWDAEGNWIVDYDPQEFIAFMNDLVVFKW